MRFLPEFKYILITFFVLSFVYLASYFAAHFGQESLETIEMRREVIDSMKLEIDSMSFRAIHFEERVRMLDSVILYNAGISIALRLEYEKKISMLDTLSVAELERFFAERYNSIPTR